MEQKLREALEEIMKITEGITEFNPTYERIYKIACEVLEKED